MTADEARKIARDAKPTENVAVDAMLQCWYQAIGKAAKAGQASVVQTAVPQPRMLISAEDRRAALARLKADGFTVTEENLIATVSWPE